ncbi:MAG: T9SS type A sorting domain-containing protein, partial [Candidatus Marinimicrobia bacterium]|nr:T9SS type A sorting domain-containing protein [Candidatus Neomarinimicrobiota bacterium]
SPAAGIYSYAEGETYPVSGPSTFQNVSYSAGTAQDITSTNLQENAAQYIRLLSDDPVLATLTNDDGPDSYLELHAILSYGDSAWTVWSGSPINVDPTTPSTIYFVVVSQNDAGSDFDFTLALTDGELSTDDPDVPKRFSVSKAYPNPFNPQTHFQIELDVPEKVSAFIYDLNGRLVKTLFDDQLNAGRHTLIWNGLDGNGNPAASGTYFVRLKGERQESWQKVTLLK